MVMKRPANTSPGPTESKAPALGYDNDDGDCDRDVVYTVDRLGSSSTLLSSSSRGRCGWASLSVPPGRITYRLTPGHNRIALRGGFSRTGDGILLQGRQIPIAVTIAAMRWAATITVSGARYDPGTISITTSVATARLVDENIHVIDGVV